jgi:hypothetical protein
MIAINFQRGNARSVWYQLICSKNPNPLFSIFALPSLLINLPPYEEVFEPNPVLISDFAFEFIFLSNAIRFSDLPFINIHLDLPMPNIPIMQLLYLCFV